MVKTLPSLVWVTGLSLLYGAKAARVCGNDTAAAPTYTWHIEEAKYDGAKPNSQDGLATIAVSITPNPGGTVFECIAEWPESWAGWYEGGSNLVWSDCIWTASGPTYDKTMSFAVDWKNVTIYFSHTYPCTDSPESERLAATAIPLGMNCTTSTNGSSHCRLKSPLDMTTRQLPDRLVAGSSCTGSPERFQSWELTDWSREYEMVPGSEASGSKAIPSNGLGPSFTLSSVPSRDVLNCAPSVSALGVIYGLCRSVYPVGSTATATFNFDPRLGMIKVTQQWDCSSSSSFTYVGVAYVQETCDQEQDMLACTTLPLWIGTTSVGLAISSLGAKP